MEKGIGSSWVSWANTKRGSEGGVNSAEFQLIADPLDSDPCGKLVVKGEVSGVSINYFTAILCHTCQTDMSTSNLTL